MANMDSHVSRVPDTCGDSNIYGHGNLISQIYICLDQFYIKWMQGARPPRIFKPIQKRRGRKEEWKKPLPSCCGSSRSWSSVSLCWPYGQSWEPSTGHCTQGIFWSQGSISPLGWTWLGTQIHTPRVSGRTPVLSILSGPVAEKLRVGKNSETINCVALSLLQLLTQCGGVCDRFLGSQPWRSHRWLRLSHVFASSWEKCKDSWRCLTEC